MDEAQLDLDNREEVERAMREYLKLECPDIFGSEFSSIELVKDIAIGLFAGQERSRVLVYDVGLQNNSEVFGTVGGILYPHHPPSTNVFPKTQIKDADMAANAHLYFEAMYRYGHSSLFGGRDGLEQLAEMLEIPEELIVNTEC